MTDKAVDRETQLDAAILHFMQLRDNGERVDRHAFLASYPQLADALRELLEAVDCIEHMAGPTQQELAATPTPTPPPPQQPVANQPSTNQPTALQSPQSAIKPSHDDSTLPLSPPRRIQRFAGSNEPTLVPPNSHLSDDRSISPLPDIDSSQPNLPCRFGDYVLERMLGRGGMGVVYQARQLQLDRTVAIKMIRSGALASEDEVARFYAEARSAAKLDHPNIVTVYQCGEFDGHHYFSMDFVQGTDLSSLLEKGPMHPRQAARLVRDVALAIAYAHDEGILHRDLKPANVLLDDEENVVVTDFGLAKTIGKETGLTATGAALGTPSYMSPEQAGGSSNDHDKGTDIYSLGAILFALLAGKPPFASETAIQTIMQVLHKPAPLLRQVRADIHVDLETIVNKCLQKQSNKRYESARALAEDLHRYLEGEPILARPLSPLERSVHWVQGIPLVAALTGQKNIDATRSHRWAQWFILAVMLLSLVSYGGGRIAWNWWRNHSLPSLIDIGAGMPGGMYQTVASQLAQRLENATGRHPTVVTTQGSDDNLGRLLQGRVDLAILQTSSVKGDRISVVAPLYHEAFHLLVRKDAPSPTIESLVGKKVAMGLAQSGTRVATRSILRHFNLKESDFQVEELDYVSIDSEEDIVAIFAMIKPGAAAIQNLLASQQWRLCSLQEAMDISNEEPTFRLLQIAPSDYPSANLTDPISTVATTAFLAARIDASERLVETALQAMYDEEPIKGILPANRAAQWKGLPWHPAARSFFDKLEE